MTVAYWIVAALLAVFYLYAGGKKAIQTKEQLQPMMAWVDTIPMPLVHTIGVLELLGAAGLILPPLTGIAPWLALAAAIGLSLIQVGGAALHLSRGETRQIPLNIILLAISITTAWLSTTWLN
ncbi:DoxX family protein [Sphaerisporangium rubeum]|uniref:Putative membrane protein n=1 Tax=Sphaerisporangium rubeum TaxID=321317 RepID=A0A7X0IIY0_9ACTN|nr:DoxX family protein [Sphaerisporangium rubeum]MBB6475810.1 putative membrane protein [Sphaerisporangium rubeum]